MREKPRGEDGYVKNLTYSTYPTDPLKIAWCCFCARGGKKDKNYVCLNGKLLDIIWNEPKVVGCFGNCKQFIHECSVEAAAVEFQGFKRKLLEATGVEFRYDRER